MLDRSTLDVSVAGDVHQPTGAARHVPENELSWASRSVLQRCAHHFDVALSGNINGATQSEKYQHVLTPWDEPETPSTASFDMSKGELQFTWTVRWDLELTGPMKLVVYVSVEDTLVLG